MRLRSPRYLSTIRELPCIICGTSPVHAHHIMTAEPSAMGLKTGDNWVVPLCEHHHRQLHERGNEDAFWLEQGVDATTEAARLWERWMTSGTLHTSSSA